MKSNTTAQTRNGIIVSVVLSPQTLELINQEAELSSSSRSRIVRLLILEGLSNKKKNKKGV